MFKFSVLRRSFSSTLHCCNTLNSIKSIQLGGRSNVISSLPLLNQWKCVGSFTRNKSTFTSFIYGKFADLKSPFVKRDGFYTYSSSAVVTAAAASSAAGSSISPQPSLPSGIVEKNGILSNSMYPDFDRVQSKLEIYRYANIDFEQSIWTNLHTIWNVSIDVFLHPAVTTMKLLNELQLATNWHWCFVIFSTTVFLRALTAVYAFFPSIVTASKMQSLQPQIQAFGDRIRDAQRSGQNVQAILQEQLTFMRAHNVSPWRLLKPMLIQAPLFMAFFLALRTLALEAHLIPSLTNPSLTSISFEGLKVVDTFSFFSLTLPAMYLPDPSGLFGFGLPFFSILASLASVLINPNMQGIPQMELSKKGQKVLFSFFIVFFTAAIVNAPATIQVYIFTTALTMLVQQLMLRSKAFQRFLGLPSNWPPSPQSLQELASKRLSPASGIAASLSGFSPIGRFCSTLADKVPGLVKQGKLQAAYLSLFPPKNTYIGIWGLKQPNAPLSPSFSVAVAPSPSSTVSATMTPSSPTFAAHSVPKQATSTSVNIGPGPAQSPPGGNTKSNSSNVLYTSKPTGARKK
jgi:YidC/Oxa1 family membrane protein insertase